MLNNEQSLRVAEVYHTTRLKVNSFLVRYGHIIPIIAVATCVIVATVVTLIIVERNHNRKSEQHCFPSSQEEQEQGSTFV